VRRWLAFLLICTSGLPQLPTIVQDATRGDDAGFVVRINVNLVQVDAVVTDLKGRRVTDLTSDDFEVLQDGVPQRIANFSYVAEGVKPATDSRASGSPVPATPTPPKREQIRRMIALVVDDLGLSFTSMAQLRPALKKFVDHNIQAGDLVAIVRTSGGVGALQQFTTDKRLLYAAIDQVKFKFMTRAARFSPAGLSRTLEPPNVGGTRAGASFQGDSAFKSLEASERCMEETDSVVGSVGAVRYVVQGLRDLPGRKALVLFSEHLSMSQPPDQVSDAKPGSAVCDYSQLRDMLRKLTDAAERSAVVIYTVDPRGVVTLAPDAASNPFAGGPTSGEHAQAILTREQEEKQTEYLWSQTGLEYLADETGGTFASHNDIAGAIGDAVDDSGNYYLIGYRPPANTFDLKDGRTKFHHVKVKVKRLGLKVRSRTGFYGFAGDVKDDPGLSDEQQFARALVSPFAENDLHLRMTTFFSQWEKPFLTTMLYIDGGDLTFTREPDGHYQAVLDAVAVTFDVNGIPVDQTRRSYTVSATDEAYALAAKNGVIFRLQQTVGKPGPVQVRVAVRDTASHKIGSANQFVEVPNLKQGHLALSGIVLRQLDSGEELSGSSLQLDQASAPDPKGNEAIRIFKPGEKIGWYYQILNAKNGPDQRASVKVEVRLFREGAEITRSEPAVAHLAQDPPGNRLVTSGHMLLTTQFLPGDYALQLVVTDVLANRKHSKASQWIDFAVENP